MYNFSIGYLYLSRGDVTPNQNENFGTIQDVTIDIDMGLKELYGQFKFPVDIAQGKGKVTGKAKTATIHGKRLNDLVFGMAGSAIASTQELVADDEAHTIGNTPYTVTINAPSSGTFLGDLGARYASNGQPLTQVTNAPAVGQYSLSNGVYTFAAADTAVAMLISYTYTVSGKTYTLANPLAGTPQTTFAITWHGKLSGKDGMWNLKKCVAGKLAIPIKMDDYQIQEFDFTAMDDGTSSPGNVLAFSYAE